MELISKTSNSLNKEINGLKLYRNDIDKFIDTYKNQGYSVLMYDKEYRYESLDDYLNNHGSVIKELTLEFSKDANSYRDARIDFKGDTMSIWATDRLDLSTAIYDHATKKKWIISYILRPYNAFYLAIPYILGMIVFAILYPEFDDLSSAEKYDHPFTKWLKYGAFGIGIFIFLTWLYQRYILGFSLEKVYKTGLNRYRSQIIVGVFVAIITFLITKSIDWLIG